MKPYRTKWPDNFPDVIVDRKLGDATGHELYQAAKSGDPLAAFHLAEALVSDEAVSNLRKSIGNNKPIIVPVHAIEASGENMIPLGAGFILAKKLDLDMDTSIVQAIKVSRTAGDGWHRLANPPYYDGKFEKGRMAILVDDTLTQGGTFASLKGHIEKQGGKVINIYALTGKQYSRQLRLSRETLNKLREKYENLEQWWKEIFGYDFSRLTEWEAKYIINSGKTVDEVRDLIIKAKQI